MHSIQRVGITVLCLALLTGAVWFFSTRQQSGGAAAPQTQTPVTAPTTTLTAPLTKEPVDDVTPLETPPKKVSAPTPLTVPKSAATATAEKGLLTRAGIIAQTNAARTRNGLIALKENIALNNAAAFKLKDMFARGYFAHIAPSGAGPEFWVTQAGYTYLAIGENLAEGMFTSDSALVSSWTVSAPHRANILDAHFEDIGVAVGKGTYVGRTTWLAVQMFGRPQSACPTPSATLKARIDAQKAEIGMLNSALIQAYAALEATEPKHGEAYREKVFEYNILVEEYNTLVEGTKQLVAQYNAAVAAYNACLKSE